LNVVDRKDDAAEWKYEPNAIAESIRDVFWDSQAGLFRAATVSCREHHIWGSAFAVYLGVADDGQSKTIARYFKDSCSQIVQKVRFGIIPPQQ